MTDPRASGADISKTSAFVTVARVEGAIERARELTETSERLLLHVAQTRATIARSRARIAAQRAGPSRLWDR